MGFLRSPAKRFRPPQENICEMKNAPSFFARPLKRALPLLSARRRRRNGDARGGSGQRSAGTRAGTRGDLAEADQGAAFEWTRSHSRGGPLDSEISWRGVFPLGKRGGCGSRARARGNDRD